MDGALLKIVGEMNELFVHLYFCKRIEDSC